MSRPAYLQRNTAVRSAAPAHGELLLFLPLCAGLRARNRAQSFENRSPASRVIDGFGTDHEERE